MKYHQHEATQDYFKAVCPPEAPFIGRLLVTFGVSDHVTVPKASSFEPQETPQIELSSGFHQDFNVIDGAVSLG